LSARSLPKSLPHDFLILFFIILFISHVVCVTRSPFSSLCTSSVVSTAYR
jgi:hypothetical protein